MTESLWVNGLLIGVLGMLVTIIVGFGVYFKQRQYPGHITFAKESCIGLFDSIVRNLPELSVLYNNSPVKENLVLIKGFILNSGTIDITEDMTEEKLTINLPQGYKWLTSKKIPSSSQVKAQTNIVKDGSQLEFNMGLFRCEEYIGFEALAEVPSRENEAERSKRSDPGKMLEKALIFSHRIGNTKKVEIQDLPTDIQHISLWKGRHILLLFTTILLGVLLGVTIFLNGIPKEINYLLNVEDNKTIEVKIKPITYEHLKVKSIDRSYYKEIPVTAFFSDYKWTPKIVRDTFPIIFTFFWYGFLILTIISIFLSEITKKYKSRKLTRILYSNM